MASLVTDSVNNFGQLASMFGTAFRWVGYGARLWQVADKATKLYATAKELRAAPDQVTKNDYIRMTTGVVLTSVEAIALYADVRSDTILRQSQTSAQKMKEELSNLKAAGEKVNQAAANVSTFRTNSQAQRALDSYNTSILELPFTDDIAEDIGKACVFNFNLQETLESGKELQTAAESLGAENLMAAAKSMNANILNCGNAIDKQLKLSNDLYRLRGTQTVCAITEFFGGLVKEATERDRFSHSSANMNLLLTGLKAYRLAYPQSKLSVYIKEHNLLKSLVDLHAVRRPAKQLAGILPSQIPENLQDDPELSKNLCSIFWVPIRCPMVIVNGAGHRFYFEEAALLSHFATRERNGWPLTNPCTNEEIDMQDAMPDPVLKRVIEKRLEALRDRWDR